MTVTMSKREYELTFGANRLYRLQRVNNAAAWAIQQLGILHDMASDRKMEAWFVSQIARIRDGIETEWIGGNDA